MYSSDKPINIKINSVANQNAFVSFHLNKFSFKKKSKRLIKKGHFFKIQLHLQQETDSGFLYTQQAFSSMMQEDHARKQTAKAQ